MKRIAFVSILCLFLTSCAELFQSKISMETDYELASLSDLLGPKEKDDQLSPPLQIFVSKGDSPSQITVSWTPVRDARSYRLERAVVKNFNEDGSYEIPDESDYSVIPGTSASTAKIYGSTSYIDTILTDSEKTYMAPEYGYRYFYRVCAEHELYGSSDFTVSQEPGLLFAPPTEIQASTGSYEDKVSLSWVKPVFDDTVQGYQIYRSENEDGTNAAYITSVKKNMDHYSDSISEQKRGISYYYTVYAVNSSGVSSCSSAIAMGYARAEGAPPQVKNVRVTNGRGYNNSSISIAWDNVGDDEIKFAIYRSSSKDSALTLLSANVTGTTYTDTKNLSPFVYYYYQIQSWKEDGDTKIKGQISDSSKTSGTPCEGYILSPPETIQVEKGIDNHTIRWTPAIGSASEQASFLYMIYGSDDLNAEFTDADKIAEIPASSLAAFEGYYSYRIKTFKYYKMATKNSSPPGEESAKTDVVSPAPYSPQSIRVSRYANFSSEIESSWTANENGIYPVKIEWTVPFDGDAYGYIVYRSDKKDKGYKKLSVNNDERTFIIRGNVFYDINLSARPGKIYYYKVLSVNVLEQGVNYSDTQFGYGALTADQYMREYNKTVKNSLKKLTLMHKSASLDKLGKETVYATNGGSLYYDAHTDGLGGRVIMRYDNYADFYIHSTGKQDFILPNDDDEPSLGTNDGFYFMITGNTNTSASMDQSGSMDGTVICKGMYPGSVKYDAVQIKGGAAGGGYYVIEREGFAAENVVWTVAEE